MLSVVLATADLCSRTCNHATIEIVCSFKNMRKFFLILFAALAVVLMTQPKAEAGIHVSIGIPGPVFYGPGYYPGYYYGPGYYAPGYYWGPYGYRYYARPYWRHRYWGHRHWRYD